MTGQLETRVTRPESWVNADHRAAATRYLTRTGNADLLDVLGLSEPKKPAVVGRQPCPRCGKPLPDPIVNGGFKRCRRRSCASAASAEEAVA